MTANSRRWVCWSKLQFVMWQCDLDLPRRWLGIHVLHSLGGLIESGEPILTVWSFPVFSSIPDLSSWTVDKTGWTNVHLLCLLQVSWRQPVFRCAECRVYNSKSCCVTLHLGLYCMLNELQLSVCILLVLCSKSFMTHGLNKKLCIAVAYWVTPLFQDGCAHFDVSSRLCIT